ncbi:fibronectin-binding autotransporter adhesin [Povalibacter uvarum]|uniref:Fibronectin-binding autotransporter adhesin n=1 Tax=Povalibacter uvarum TaxID=732238 RepID=A0A841HJU7_9GAMM|nr:autotransporter-associated beta strand repeat-containing protein [Povalibacter uvarum]MBB6092422.1 fibronectin-binding autotransporter adhesin [Povalibacter uvarum]
MDCPTPTRGPRTHRTLVWTLTLSAVALGSYAHAQSLTWDVNGATAGTGNSATPANNVWNTTDARWFNGTTHVIWNNGALSDAVFGGTAGTVTIGTPITVHNVTFSANNYALTGSALTLAGVTPTIAVNTTTATINAVIDGSAGLRKTGTGLLILAGVNTYSGLTAITAGTLRLSNIDALSVNSNLAISGSAIVELNAGDFTRAVGTGVNEVQWTGSAGFGALGATRIVNLGGVGDTLIWSGTPGFLGNGQTLILSSAGSTATLDWRNPIDLNGDVRTLQINNGSAATDVILGGPISNGSLTYSGAGTVLASGINTYAGVTTLNGPVVRVNTIGNGGVAGGLGAASSDASNLVFNANSSILTYAGTGESTERNFSFGAATQAHIASSGTGALVWNGTADIASGARTLVLRGTNTAANIFNGLLENDGGTLALTKADAGLWRLTAANTYTGVTSVTGGTLEVTSLANGGLASGIGASTNAASNLILNNSGLRYVGADPASTDRNFTGTTAPRIESSGTGALTWAGTMTPTGAATLTLGGTNTGANVFAGALTDFNPASARTSVIKAGTGVWALSGLNLYSGDTRIDAGVLAINDANALYGGLGSGAASPGSLLVFNGGVLGLTSASGDFTRSIGTTQFLNGVRWQTGGGFAAFGGDRVVDIGGAGAALTWTAAGFVPNAQSLIFGHAASDSMVDFRNGIALGAASRTVTVNDGTAAIDAMLSGVLSGTGGGLTKAGTGTLALTNNNTYTGATTISAGVLQVGNGGATGTLGTGAVTNNAALAINRSDSLTLGQLISGTGSVRLNGSGTTVLTAANTYSGGTQVNSGTLQIGNGGTTGAIGTGAVTNNSTLAVNRSNAVTLANVIVGTGSLRQDGAGTTSLTGANTYAGDTLINAGTLQIGAAGTTGTLGTGAVINNATLAVNRTNTTIVSNAISGNGVVRQVGTGTTALAASNTYTGGTVVTAGTLQIGNGGTTGDAGTGNITNNATFAINRSDAYALNQVVSGTGTLRQAGTGTTILTATNAYGATAIAAGTLQVGSGGTSGTLGTGAVTNNGTLAIDRSDALSLGQLISGTGSVRQNGAGATTLTANNTYTGGTIVNAGTLRVGNGGTTGSAGTGTITNNAALSLNRSNAVTLANVIAGTGVVSHDGAGVTTASGTNSFTGALELNAGVFAVSNLQNGGITSNIGASSNAAGNLNFDGGTLRYTGAARSTDRNFIIEDGGAILEGSGTAALTWNGTASYDLADQARALTLTGTFSGNIFAGALVDNGTGALSLTKSGAGRWILAGNNAYSGTTTISAGTLQIGNGGTSGTLGTGAVTNNGTLSFMRSDALAVTSNINGTGTINQAGSGTTQLDGTVSANATTITAGTLRASGTLTTPTIALSNGTTLDVLGTAGAAAGATSTISATTGVNTVRIASGATLRATGDLNSGDDVLDVAGTLNTGAGTLTLGAGNDTFTLREGATIVGTVNGGTGTNTFNTDILTSATLGSATGFQTLLKTGAGALNVTGATTGFTSVNTSVGTLNVNAGASITGVVTSTVGSGATLNVAGTYSGTTGNDTFAVAGTVSGAGTIDLGSGIDTLTLSDGAGITGRISGGAHTSTGDLVTLNNAAALSLDAASITAFERLIKQNTGNATLTGAHTFTSGATLNAGTLSVGGSLTAPTLTMANDTTVRVSGSTQASPTTGIAITGSAGTNSVVIEAGGTLRATGGLGAGSDLLDVAGTLNLGAAVFDLGDGDDTLTVRDSANILGTVTGGTGVNTFNTDITTTADLGAVTGFQTLLKTGGGVLNINGLATSAFTAVDVQTGTLNVAATGNITGVVNASIGNGATLNVSGAYSGSGGADSWSIGGTVSGSGTIGLAAGDDVLTLNDGAVLSSSIDGGSQGTVDRVVLNNSAALTLSGSRLTGFEALDKINAGTATLAGVHAYGTTRVDAGTLSVAGSLDSSNIALSDGATLEVLGTVRAGGSATSIAGSAGANLITVAGGGLLRAGGDTGDGTDTLRLAGTLDTGAATLTLGDGDDTLILDDGGSIMGSVVGGSGTNTFNTNINTVADLSTVTGFQTLLKTGTGTLNINGPGTSVFTTLTGLEGTVNIAAAGVLSGVSDTTIDSLAVLNVDGSFFGSGGDDRFVVSGALTGSGMLDLGAGDDLLDVVGSIDLGSGTFDLGDGDDTLTTRDGTRIVGTVSGGSGTNTLNTTINGIADLDALTGFQSLIKTGTGTLNINGPGTSVFNTVTVSTGRVNVAVAATIDPSTTLIESAGTLHVDGSYLGTAGDDSMVIEGTVSGAGLVDLGAGDDVLTIREGAAITAAIDGGAQSAGDAVVLDSAASLSFDGATLSGFERLIKQGAGSAALTGAQSYDSLSLVSGVLAVGGQVGAANTILDGGILRITGTLEGLSGSTTTTITGSAGANAMSIANGAMLSATGDLADGADAVSIAGTLRTGAGVLSLGGGDDSVTLEDGSSIVGRIDGGAQAVADTLIVNLTGGAVDGSSLSGFEALDKRSTGTLTLSGAHNYVDIGVAAGELSIGGITETARATLSNATTLDVRGLLQGTSGSQAIVSGSAGANTIVVGSGATLRAGGSLGDGADLLDVAGTLETTLLDLGDGDDTLMIHDGTSIQGTVAGGGGNNAFNTNIAGTATLGAITGFQTLVKSGAGTLDILGIDPSSFSSVAVDAGALRIGAGGSIGGVQTTTVAADATLRIEGEFRGSATGDLFTVVGTALSTGLIDLGQGADVLDVVGTLDLGTGVFDLGDGDDTLTIHDDTRIVGTVAGGAGTNTFNTNIATSADLGAVTGFQTLSKTGAGTLNILGADVSSFTTVAVSAGTLSIASTGSAANTRTTSVDRGAILNVDGSFFGSDSPDSMTISGTVAGNGSISLGAGSDLLRLRDGAVLDAVIDGGDELALGDTIVLDNADAMVFDTTRVVDFETLMKLGSGTATLSGDAAFAMGVNVDSGTLLANRLTTQVLAIAPAAAFYGNEVIGNVSNAGVMGVNAASFGRLAIRGDYVGNNGRIDMRVALGDDSSQSDVVEIDGGSATGTTRIRVINEGGLGARTTGSGIQLIETVNGATTTDDAFTLDAPVMAGAYRYDLFHGDADDTDPQGWYLRSLAPVRDMASLSTTLVPMTYGYGLSLMSSLQERDGADLRESCDGTAASGCQWGRVWYRSGERNGGGTAMNGANFDYDYTGLQVGTDIHLSDSRDSDDRAGVFFNAGRVSADAQRDDFVSAGQVEARAYSLAAYWTHRDDRWYVDSALAGTYMTGFELQPSEDNGAVTNAWSLAASIEGGGRIAMGSRLSLQPQLQIVAQHIRQSDTQAVGAEIRFDESDIVAGRAGLTLEAEILPSTLNLWLRTNYWSELVGDASTTLVSGNSASTTFDTLFEGEWLDVSAGAALKLSERSSLHLSVTSSDGLGDTDSRSLQGNLGFRFEW